MIYSECYICKKYLSLTEPIAAVSVLVFTESGFHQHIFILCEGCGYNVFDDIEECKVK